MDHSNILAETLAALGEYILFNIFMFLATYKRTFKPENFVSAV